MRSITSLLTTLLGKTGLLEGDLDYHLLRASMVIIFLFFGYQKWWDYEAQTLIPFISNGPLISWAASAGGFPAMTGNVPFLMKDVVLLAVSVYLLKQDAARALATARADVGIHGGGRSRGRVVAVLRAHARPPSASPAKAVRLSIPCWSANGHPSAAATPW